MTSNGWRWNLIQPALKFTRPYLLNHKRYQAHLLTRERGFNFRQKIALAAGYEFSFKFRTRVARQGGFAPLKSPTGGRAPRPPPRFIAFLNAGWWDDFCVKILNQNLKRWRSYGLPKICPHFWFDCDHSFNQEGWFWVYVTTYWFWGSKFSWFAITSLTIMYSMKHKIKHK